MKTRKSKSKIEKDDDDDESESTQQSPTKQKKNEDQEIGQRRSTRASRNKAVESFKQILNSDSSSEEDEKKKKKLESKSNKKKKRKSIDDDDDDDEEFKLDREVEEEDEEEDENEEDEGIEEEEDEDDDDVLSEAMEEDGAESELLDQFDKDLKIEEWKYELDSESRAYRRPKLPQLSDKAIEPFLSSKSKPKSQIYECPHCKRPFTYTLVFKSHLYSCSSNQNAPKYVLRCSRYPKCSFEGEKKQEMISHFSSNHAKGKKSAKGTMDQIVADFDVKLTSFKQNQLEVSHYSFVNKKELKFTHDLYDGFYGQYYKRLGFMDHHFETILKSSQSDKPIQLKLNQLNESTLNFELNNKSNELERFSLKPFEIFQSTNESIVLNVKNNVTAIDWSHGSDDVQYLAFATFPIDELKQIGDQFVDDESFRALIETSNLIYFVKITNMGDRERRKVEFFAYLNETIGLIYGLKFRPDYGASQRDDTNSFIGYLLATSSDGNGYIYYARDLSHNNNSKRDSLNVYKQKPLATLSLSFSFGQCTSCDWSQLNGSTQIALGYSNGSIALFHLNSNCLNSPMVTRREKENLLIYPVKTFLAHDTLVKSVKWSKSNPNILATGSLFNRELRIWDLRNQERKPVIDFETFCTDFEFSLHSNDLFITKEINLKGENRLTALDLTFNLRSHEKDDTKSHSSLFYSYSTMNSLHISDYLSKILICDTDGSIILSRSTDANYWVQKNKLINHSYSFIAKFMAKGEEENGAEAKQMNKIMHKIYDPTEILKKKSTKTIQIDLKARQSLEKPKSQLNSMNSMNIDVNSLNQIKWNKNRKFLNWFAVSSMSGFIFLNKLAELDFTM